MRTDTHKAGISVHDMLRRERDHQRDEEATRKTNDPRKPYFKYAYTCPNCGSGQNIGGTCNICMFKVK